MTPGESDRHQESLGKGRLDYNQKDDLTAVKDLVSGLTLYELTMTPMGTGSA